MFTDRTDAGERLADLVERRGVDADIVLAVPRGGLPLGRAVADRLGVPLDIVSARKLGAPGNPELAVGAVAGDGTVWLNEPFVEDLDIDRATLEEQVERERAVARGKVARYRGDRAPPDLRGRTVLIVDDGVATGATLFACVRQVRNAGADRVVVAVPVAPPETVEELGAEADDVLCVETPRSFRAVGQFYESFDQVSDDEARAYLTFDGE